MLKAGLLDPGLQNCFAELADALFCCDKKSTGAGALMDSITFTIKGSAFGAGTVNLTQVTLATPSGPISLNASGTVLVTGVNTFTLPLPALVDPSKVQGIICFSLFGQFPTSPHYLATDIDVTYHAAGGIGSFALASVHSPQEINSGSAFSIPAAAELPPEPKGSNPCLDASCCVQKLLAHLNCHKRYYNGLVWMNEDPNDRVMRWCCCEGVDGQFSLIGNIENNPIAIYGDFVVFPVAGSVATHDTPIPSVSRLVTLPTPGVYSEGLLGQCNTCETINPDTNWNWKDCGCTDLAPAISPPPTPQASAAASGLKLDGLTNLVTFGSVPASPDSVLKDVIASLAAKAGDGGADASKALEALLTALKDAKPDSKPSTTGASG